MKMNNKRLRLFYRKPEGAIFHECEQLKTMKNQSFDRGSFNLEKVKLFN